MEFEAIYDAVIVEGTEVFCGAVGIVQDCITKKIIVHYDADDGTLEMSFERFEAAFAVFQALTEGGTTVHCHV